MERIVYTGLGIAALDAVVFMIVPDIQLVVIVDAFVILALAAMEFVL